MADHSTGAGGSPLRRLLGAPAREAASTASALRRVYRDAFVDTGRPPGVCRGTVVEVQDPSGAGRLQVSLDATGEVLWSARCVPFGVEAGAMPVLGDRVWLAFEGGDPHQPVVLGRLG